MLIRAAIHVFSLLFYILARSLVKMQDGKTISTFTAIVNAKESVISTK